MSPTMHLCASGHSCIVYGIMKGVVVYGGYDHDILAIVLASEEERECCLEDEYIKMQQRCSQYG